MVGVFNQKIHVVILAAGVGRRLRPLTFYNPKPMVKVKGETILSQLINKIPIKKVKSLTVVVGYHGHIIESSISKMNLPFDVNLVKNWKYRNKHCASSLVKVQKLLTKNILVFNSDVVFSPNALNRIFCSKFEDSFVVCKPRGSAFSDLQKVNIQNNYINNWSLNLTDYNGEVIGPVYINPEIGTRMNEYIVSHKSEVEKMPCFTFFSNFMTCGNTQTLLVDNFDAFEIDEIGDLKECEKNLSISKLSGK